MAGGLEDECGLASCPGGSTMGPRRRAAGKEAITSAPLSQLPGPGCLPSLPAPCLFSLLPGFSVEPLNSKIPTFKLSFPAPYPGTSWWNSSCAPWVPQKPHGHAAHLLGLLTTFTAPISWGLTLCWTLS